MRFIEILFENSGLKQAKLYQAAQKAHSKPDTGIVINHQGAYNVIKDCAMVTLKYLPHFIFGSYNNPFASLRGKFKRPEIEEFVQKSRDDFALGQLLIIILDKYNYTNQSIAVDNNFSSQQTYKNDVDDPYGLYASVDDTIPKTTNTLSDVDVLCLAFDVE